jgi:hypothetical protein
MAPDIPRRTGIHPSSAARRHPHSLHGKRFASEAHTTAEIRQRGEPVPVVVLATFLAPAQGRMVHPDFCVPFVRIAFSSPLRWRLHLHVGSPASSLGACLALPPLLFWRWPGQRREGRIQDIVLSPAVLRFLLRLPPASCTARPLYTCSLSFPDLLQRLFDLLDLLRSSNARPPRPSSGRAAPRSGRL